MCTPESHTGILMRLVEETGAQIYAPSYRRPPESPFPVPVDDCVAAYEHLLNTLAVDPAYIVFAGDSAGGGLAVQAIFAARKKGLPLPAGAMLLSPWVDLTDEETSDSWERNARYDYLPADLATLFAHMYKGDASWDDVCPTRAPREDLASLPPLLLEVGECEVLHDQIIKFAAKCIDAGVVVDVNVRRDMVHVFQMFAATGVPQCGESYAAMGAFCRRVTGTGNRPSPVVDTPLMGAKDAADHQEEGQQVATASTEGEEDDDEDVK